jgi:alpha-amylase/alpha-mannosidase (GH57 family)
VSRPALVVHGHFYQPPRLDPFTGTMPLDPTAAPARDWNERTSADCYRPNAELGNLGAISWDLGPTLAGWMEHADPVAYRGFVDGDAGSNGMAQPFHHAILPLAPATDRLTEIRWGVRDFEVRFGRRPSGMWLPETAVDLATLRLLAEHGISYTILAPWQVDDGGLRDPRRPIRVDLGDGRSMVVIRYDGLLSAAVSFEPWSTIDADAFVSGHIAQAMASRSREDDEEQLLVIATDGELYGHHRPFREHFLARLVGRTAPTDLPYDRPSLGDAVARADARGLEVRTLRERTSWSCDHGIDRWMSGCGCVQDGEWKAPLRGALDRLAGGIDAATDHVARALPGSPDPWALRDAWVDVVLGVRSAGEVIQEHIGETTSDDGAVLARLMEAQRWRLSMFASCAWFWDRADRIETAGALRAATRAARVVDGIAGTDLERRLVGDLRLIEADGVDGVALLEIALRAVGAPAGLGVGPENPSARGLRATG